MIALLLLGCAPHLRYEPVLWPVPAPLSRTEVLYDLERDVARGRLPSIVANGEPVAPDALPDPIAWAVWWTATPKDRGIELDLLVGDLAVEVTRSLDGDTRVRWAERVRAPASAEAAALRARYGVACVDGDRRWKSAELGELSRALSLLSGEELALVRDVELWRMAASPRQPLDELAWYDPTVVPVRIEVYDQAFVDEGSGFVGPPSHPLGPGASTVLHELGHALADAPIRRAYDAYTAANERGADEWEISLAWWTYRDRMRHDAVLDAWRDVWDRPGPSTYGARQPAEAFAEAFMLHHADPHALARVAPEAARWFTAGGHIAAAQAD